MTSLHLAAARGHAEIVRLLLNAGADPEIVDSRHESTPTAWTQFFGHIVSLLREARFAHEHRAARRAPRHLPECDGERSRPAADKASREPGSGREEESRN